MYAPAHVVAEERGFEFHDALDIVPGEVLAIPVEVNRHVAGPITMLNMTDGGKDVALAAVGASVVPFHRSPSVGLASDLGAILWKPCRSVVVRAVRSGPPISVSGSIPGESVPVDSEISRRIAHVGRIRLLELCRQVA
jgi:hypothetical protein